MIQFDEHIYSNLCWKHQLLFIKIGNICTKGRLFDQQKWDLLRSSDCKQGYKSGPKLLPFKGKDGIVRV